MRSSKLLIRVGKIVLFLVIVFAAVSFLNKALYPINSRTYQTVSSYEKVDAADLLFLGPSTASQAYPALYMGSLTGCSAYNLATGGQTLLSGDMLLNESIRAGKIPKSVFLSITVRSLTNSGNNKEDLPVFNTIGFSLNKLITAIRGYDLESLPDALLACFRAREYFTLETFTEEKKPHYTMADWEIVPEEHREYMGAGFWKYYTSHVEAGHAQNETFSRFSAKKIKKIQTEAFGRIVKTCRDHNIELIVLIDPKPPSATIQYDYGVFTDCVRELTAQYGVSLWNLAFLKRDVFDADSTVFRDSSHVTSPTAFKLTKVLSQMYKEHVEGTLDLSDYLYDDYEQYLQAYSGIQAILAKTKSAPKIEISVIAGDLDGQDIEYRVSAAAKGSKKYKVIQDWKSWKNGESIRLNKLLKKKKGTYSIRLEARRHGGEIEQTSEYKKISW